MRFAQSSIKYRSCGRNSRSRKKAFCGFPDFPLLQIPAAKTKAAPRAAQNKIPALQGAAAFHPRQTIFTDSLHPTHPRQTLINPAAPPIAPKILPSLPNMVQLAQSAAPVRPRIEISQQALKMLHPHAKRFATNPNATAPEVQMSQLRTADFALATASEEPTRPKLQLNTGAAPRKLRNCKRNWIQVELPSFAALRSPTIKLSIERECSRMPSLRSRRSWMH